MIKAAFWIAAIVFLALGGSAVAQDRPLFEPIDVKQGGADAEALLTSDSASALSASLVRFNPDIVNEAAGDPGAWKPFVLNVADGLTVTVRTSSYEFLGNDLVRWTLEGEGTTASLIIEGDNIAGTVRSGNCIFKLYGTGTSLLDRLAEPGPGQEVEGVDQRETGEITGEAKLVPTALCNADHHITIPPAKGPHPSILILWTPAAATWLTGQKRPVATEVQQIMDLMRSAMQGTWFGVYPQLAGSQQISYTEAGPQLDPDLNALTNGSITGVAQLRNQSRADLVLLIGHFPKATACGLAWVNDNAETTNTEKYGFAVANVDVDPDNLICDLTMSAVHEVGHNFGMRHDKPNGGTSRLSYNFGYVNLAAKVRTIMAYDTQCSAKGYSCQRLGLFSDPAVMAPKGNGAMGAPDAHNMEVLCRTASSIEHNR